MSTPNDEQENSTPELTNLIDVVAAETITEVEVKVEIEAKAEEVQAAEIEEKTEAVEVVKEAVVEETELVTKTAVSQKADKPIAQKPAKAKKQKKKQRPKRSSAVTSQNVKSWFATCGRCGFFLSAYQMIESADDLETAVSHTNGRWLTFNWNYEIRNLVNKSYGCNPDTGIYHLDGICPECRRRFIYHAGEKKTTFRIALHPAIKR